MIHLNKLKTKQNKIPERLHAPKVIVPGRGIEVFG